MKSIVLTIIFQLIISGYIFAQESPQLVIKDETKSGQQLKLSELDIDIKVIANLATTTMTMKFYNGLDRVLEGELIFPLDDGQTVSCHF